MVSSGKRTFRVARSPGRDLVRRTAEVKALLHIAIAYIDPGSGSLIIQALIATVIAAPLVFRNQLRRAAGAIRRAVSAVRTDRPKE
jgi:hypothetical protein